MRLWQTTCKRTLMHAALINLLQVLDPLIAWFLIHYNLFLHLNSTLMKISSINLSAFFALILVHILIILCSSLCLCHGEVPPGEGNHISRKLLSSVASFPSGETKSNGTMKVPKKAVEPSLRKAPASVPNPTQN